MKKKKFCIAVYVGGRGSGVVWKVVILSGPASSHSPNTKECVRPDRQLAGKPGGPAEQLRSNKVATCPACDPSSQTGRLHWTPARPLTPLTAGAVVMGSGWTDEWMLFVESTLPKGSCIYPASSLEPD